MKKLLSILSLAGAMVLATGCSVTIGWDDTDFTITGSATGEKTATITIKWDNGANLKAMGEPTFTVIPSGYNVNKIEWGDGELKHSPATVVITFNEELSDDVTGRLGFSYQNTKTGASCDFQEELTITVN